MKILYSLFAYTIMFVFLCSMFMMPVAFGQEPGETIVLPAPLQKGFHSVEELLWKRHSTREFSSKSLSLAVWGQLLWAAQGINRPEDQKRTAPSAGSTYPLELYSVLPDGVYHYNPTHHSMKKIKAGERARLLSDAGLGGSTILNAQGVFIFTAVLARTESKYGKNALGYVYLEAGHAAQNLLLQAEALGLGSVPIGSVLSGEQLRKLGIPSEETHVYVLVVGYPRQSE